MAHTPSPWFRESDINDDGSDWILVTKDYELIADLRLDSGLNPVSENEQDANAFLIAAAPELLAACHKLFDADLAVEEDERKHQLKLARLLAAEAIAKAEGRSE